MKSLFVLACYFDSKNPVIYNAIKSIRHFHPSDDIVVVDSGSQDKSYFAFLQENDVIVEDVNNKNYDTGAYWFAFKKYQDNYDFFYFIHDSVILKNNLGFLKNNKVNTLKYFYSIDDITSIYTVTNRRQFLKQYLYGKLFKTTQLYDIYGFNDAEQKAWLHKKLKATKYFVPKYFVGLFGPIFMVSKDVMMNLLSEKIDTILPTNKNEQMAMERLFGIVLSQEGFDITKSSLLGDFKNQVFENDTIQKIILNRK